MGRWDRAERYGMEWYEWSHLRDQILRRDNRKCHYCDESATTVDHVVPVSKGGSTTPDNLVAACEPCNRKKADRGAE